jgi:hypothetical protein
MRVSKVITLIAPLAVALMVAPALAHGPGAACNGPGGACSGIKGQIKNLCSGATPGTCMTKLCGPTPPTGPGAWAQCLLNANTAGTFKPALSTNCVNDLKAKLAAIQEWQKAFEAACGDPTDAAFCSNVTGGTGSTIQCLRQAVIDNKPVSSPCQALLAKHHGHHGHHHWNGAKGATPGN